MLDVFERAALAAGKVILDICARGPTTSYKADCSPVTEADECAERIILDALAQNFPGLPVVAEESVAHGRVPSIANTAFILVDPLDGTAEFIAGRREFTVNIALIENGVPVAGVVYAPALGVAYCGDRHGAHKQSIGPDFSARERQAIRARPAGPAVMAVASRSHNTPETEHFLRISNIAETCAIGSSLKFCLLAEGSADVYPRFGRTMEWDTAAGDAILRAAGGSTVMLDGLPLTYGKTNQPDDADFANPHFISWGLRADAATRLQSA